MGRVVERPQRLGHCSAAQLLLLLLGETLPLCSASQVPHNCIPGFSSAFGLGTPNHRLSSTCLLYLVSIGVVYTNSGMPISPYLFTKETKPEARRETYLCYLSSSDPLELEDLQQGMHRPHLQVPPSDQPPVLWVSLSRWEMALLFPYYLLVNPFKRPDLLSSSLLGPHSLWVVHT